MEENRERIKELESEKDKLYAEVDQKEKYQLFSACIHQGVAGSGHYWTHIRDLEKDKWVKYNDVRVNHEEEESVMKDAIGQARNATSAYFLIYVRDRQNTDFSEDYRKQTVEGMQAKLKEQVQESNDAFTKELQEWEKKGMTSGDKFQQIQFRYTARVSRIEMI